MRSSEEIIKTLIAKILNKMQNSVVFENSSPRDFLLENFRLFSKNEEYQTITSFIITLEALLFINADHRLKIGAEKIWQSQHDVFSEKLKYELNSLEMVATSYGADISNEISDINKREF